MPLPRPVVRLAARARPLVPEGAWPMLLAARSLLGEGPILSPAPAGTILSLCAHPDDDTIGCGGTLALAAAAGARIVAAVATSGEASVGTAMDAAALATARQADARRAYEVLGVDDVRWLGLPDGQLAAQADALAAAVAGVLDDVRPDAVLVPWCLDGHPDHRAVHQALLACTLDPDLEVWSHEVWTPLVPNRHVDITSVHERKEAALAEHRTASQAFDVSSLAALSRFRAAHTLRGKGAAEAFVVGSPEQMRHLADQLTGS